MLEEESKQLQEAGDAISSLSRVWAKKLQSWIIESKMIFFFIRDYIVSLSFENKNVIEWNKFMLMIAGKHSNSNWIFFSPILIYNHSSTVFQYPHVNSRSLSDVHSKRFTVNLAYTCRFYLCFFGNDKIALTNMRGKKKRERKGPCTALQFRQVCDLCDIK